MTDPDDEEILTGDEFEFSRARPVQYKPKGTRRGRPRKPLPELNPVAVWVYENGLEPLEVAAMVGRHPEHIMKVMRGERPVSDDILRLQEAIRLIGRDNRRAYIEFCLKLADNRETTSSFKRSNQKGQGRRVKIRNTKIKQPSPVE